MTNTIHNVPRELLERAWRALANSATGREIGAYLDADPCAPECAETCARASMCSTCSATLSAPSPAGVEGLEVVGHIDSDDDVSGSYAVFRNDCDLRDGTELVRLSDAMRAIARIQDECELLMNFKIAYNEWQDKTEWVQQTATVKELGKHRADVLKDRLSGWIARMNQPYDDADLGN